MDRQDWLERWVAGNIGWHQQNGNESLRCFWPALTPGERVLVPLCGKSVDIMWLAGQGLDVTGVEISAVAIEKFFAEQTLSFELDTSGQLACYRAREQSIALYCGDYFEFIAPQFDALFDRASLIALDASLRPAYVQHTKSLLKEDAAQLLITLEYEQRLVNGPPYCVLREEVAAYWPKLKSVKEQEALASCPPKFRDAGLSQVNEVTWLYHRA